jgi:hypothetical protein
MNKRTHLLAATALAVLATVVSGGTTAAAPPVGGCPALFSLISLEDLARLVGVTLEEIQETPGIDINQDLQTCYRILPNGRFSGLDHVVPDP